MKVTNKLNLPVAFVHAVSVDRHNQPGCYSATTLNKGVKEILLSDRHFDEIEVDAADRIFAVFGTAVHALLEHEPDNNFHEESFKTKVLNSYITGQIDNYDLEHAVLYDWKTASIWKIKMGDFSDWHSQGMTYAWLLQQAGLPIKECVFIAFLKDHSKTKAATEADYPQSPVYIYRFKPTEKELKEHAAWIENKIQEIENAVNLEDDAIPPCSQEERWADGEKWAVMKNGRIKAVKLHDNQMDAEAQAGAMGNSYYVVHRPAVSRKCSGYCPCKDFCSFYKKEVEAQNGKS